MRIASAPPARPAAHRARVRRCRSTTPRPTARRSRCSPARRSPRASATRTCRGCVFLQGGPGGRSRARPAARAGWAAHCRTTACCCSTSAAPAGRRRRPARRSAGLPDPQRAGRHLTHFRADSIVRDAELLRRELLGDEPWTVLGQSYGGFAALTYLSLAPEGLREVMHHRWAPAAGPHCRRRLPRDVRRGSRRGSSASSTATPRTRTRWTPSPTTCTATTYGCPRATRSPVPRLQQLGIWLGHGDGPEMLHYLLETALGRRMTSCPTSSWSRVEGATTFVDRRSTRCCTSRSTATAQAPRRGRRSGCATSSPSSRPTCARCCRPAR